jgi:hypothetical protein
MLSMFKTVPLVPVTKNVASAPRSSVMLVERPEESDEAVMMFVPTLSTPRERATAPVVVRFFTRLQVLVAEELLIVRLNGTAGAMSSTCVAGAPNDWVRVHVPAPVTVSPVGITVETETPLNP